MIYYSFIIPHKNSPDLLKRCLDSIPKRSDIEIIVIDDNSDESKKPVVLRSDVRIINITADKSKGAGHARNVGLEKACGKWLLFADCDDYYSDCFVNRLDAYKHSNLDILYFRAYTRIEGDTTGRLERSWVEKTIDHYQSSKKTERDRHWLGLSHTCPWNKMYNHEFIMKINCRFEEIAMGNDAWFVNYAGSRAQKIEVIDDYLYNYMILSGGITMRKRPLSHHIDVINSDKKRNRLKVQLKYYDLLFVPGFNKKVVIRDFGMFTYWRLFIKRVLTEPYFDLALIRVVLRKFNLVEKYK